VDARRERSRVPLAHTRPPSKAGAKSRQRWPFAEVSGAKLLAEFASEDRSERRLPALDGHWKSFWQNSRVRTDLKDACRLWTVIGNPSGKIRE